MTDHRISSHPKRCVMKRIYIAAYHQSKFGKLMAMMASENIQNAILGDGGDQGRARSGCRFDGATGDSSQPAGLLAAVDGDGAGLWPASPSNLSRTPAPGRSGRALLSRNFVSGWGDAGISAVGYEKMRDNEGKMDGKLIGKALGYFPIPMSARARYSSSSPVRRNMGAT